MEKKSTDGYNVHIGEIIKKEFHERCINQAKLARVIGCSGGNINKIFGRNSIDTELLLRISITIGVNLFEPYNKIMRNGAKSLLDNILSELLSA